MYKAKQTTHIQVPKKVKTGWRRCDRFDIVTYKASDSVLDEHIPYFARIGAELVSTDKVVEDKEEPKIVWTYSKLKELNTKEQKTMLKELTTEKPPKLEEDRIKLILELI